MFIGHYGVSFVIKGSDNRIPLWVLFIAVQLVDVFWAIFVLVGLEKVRITPGITASNPLDLYYMPYTHSLVASFIWSVIGFFAYRVIRIRRSNGLSAFLVAVAVLSHWVLDFLVHRPDLPLYDDTSKQGLGLWNYPALAFALEGGLLLAGILLYMRSTMALSRGGKYGMYIFGVVMLILQAIVFFGAPPPSNIAAAITALFLYMFLACISYWLEKKRAFRSPPLAAR